VREELWTSARLSTMARLPNGLTCRSDSGRSSGRNADVDSLAEFQELRHAGARLSLLSRSVTPRAAIVNIYGVG
jgi:hypothetical protein